MCNACLIYNIDLKESLVIENLYNSNREVCIYTGMIYRNCFENNGQIWQLFSKQLSSYNKNYVQ